MKKIYFFYLFFVCFFSAVAQVNSPVELLTAPLREIRFFDAETAVAFGRGTITRTGDGGQTWNMISLGKGSRQDEPFKECEILDENTAIILGDNATLLKTTDKGVTWQNVTIDLGEEENINYTGISFINNQLGYIVGTSYGINSFPTTQRVFTTSDGGETWNLISTLTGPEYYLGLKIKFLDDQTGLSWAGSSIYKTVDGGVVWSTLQKPAGINDNDFINTLKIDNGVIVASYSTYNPFYISNDLGDSWQNIDVLSFAGGFFYDSAIFEFKNNKIYVTAGSGTPSQGNLIVYDVSTDELVANPIPYDITRSTSVRFFDENTGYLITRGNGYGYTPGRKILRTDDGGVTWEEQDSFTFDSSDVTKLKIKKSNNNYVLSKQEGSSSGIGDFYVFISDDGGAQWNLKIKENDVRGELLFSKGQYISYVLYSSQGEDTLKESNDFGETWTSTEISNPFDDWAKLYEQTDENILIMDSLSNKRISFNKGQNWQQIPFPQLEGVEFYEIKIKSETEIYSWGKYNNWPQQYEYYLYKSNNFGETWEQVVTIPDNGGNDLGVIAASTFIGDDIAIVSTGGNTYFKVDLLNLTYEQIPFNHPLQGHAYVDEDFFQLLSNSSWLYNTGAYTGEQVIKITTDSGVTWQEIKCEVCGRDILFDNLSAEIMTTDEYYGAEKIGTFLPTTPVIIGDRECDQNEFREYSIENVNEDTVYWTLVSGGEIIGTDEGNSIQVHWTEAGKNKLMAMRSNSYGDSSYGTAFVDVNAVAGLDDIAAGYVTVVPNPFNNHVTITADHNDLIQEVSIVSVTGQVLYNYNVGVSDFTINGLETLPKGIYFLRLNTVDGTVIKKIMKK